MNSNNENKQLAILICIFLITSIITVFVVVLGIKSIKTSDKKDYTEPKVEITEYTDETTDDNIVTTDDNGVSVNKLMLDTEEMMIEVLSVESGEKNGTRGLILKTNIENNLDKRIIVDAVDEYVNNSSNNISYYFTVEKLEKLEKDMFIPASNTDDIKLEFNINISDSLEQTLLYQSTDIAIHISGKEVTVIKSSLLEDKVNNQDIVEDNNEVVEDNTDIIEEKPVDIDNNEQDTEEIIKNEDKKPEKEEEKTTVIGDYRYGFYTLPGEFKLISQDENYIEYKSSDFITVSINYREDTTINDFKIELFERYSSIYPEAKFKEVDSKYVPADMILETSEIIIKSPDNEVNENTEDSEQTIIQGGFTYRVYKYQVASNSGNYVMLVTTSPNKNDIVTIGILVPYELTDYFSEFVNKVEKSYEFVQ